MYEVCLKNNPHVSKCTVSPGCGEFCCTCGAGGLGVGGFLRFRKRSMARMIAVIPPRTNQMPPLPVDEDVWGVGVIALGVSVAIGDGVSEMMETTSGVGVPL